MGKAGKKRGSTTLDKIMEVLKAEDSASTGLQKRKIVNLVYERYPSELGSSRKAVEQTVSWYLSMYREEVFVNRRRGMWALKSPDETTLPKATEGQHHASEDPATLNQFQSAPNGRNIPARASSSLGDEAEGSSARSSSRSKLSFPRSVAIQGGSGSELVWSGLQPYSHEPRYIGASHYAIGTNPNISTAEPQSGGPSPVLSLPPPRSDPSMTSPKRQGIAVNNSTFLDSNYSLFETDHGGMGPPPSGRSTPPGY